MLSDGGLLNSDADGIGKTTFSMSGGLVELLARLQISLAFTSYQSGLFYLLGQNQGGANLHQCAIARPMGLARDGAQGLVMSAGHQLIRFQNPLTVDERVNGRFDACYVPRTMHLTGQLDAHDIGVGTDGELVFVNTRLNCLAALDPVHSFKEVWRPSFVSALVDEDRCHLNGLAMRDGEAAFVTAASRSDTIDGWRDRRAAGGVVIDVKRNEVICEGLSMPHSPRWHDGELWVLNAGTGELGVIEDVDNGSAKFVARVFCPGFARGLTFYGGYAFVGLSKPRYQRFEGLALDERLKAADSEPWCGIQVIDLARGTCAEWFRIDGAVEELYDVEALPGVMLPMAISPNTPEAVRFVTWAGRQPAAVASDGGAAGAVAEDLELAAADSVPAGDVSTASNSSTRAKQSS